MSDYLFARPSFLSGAARALDLFGVFDSYNESLTPAEADVRALACDFLAVEADMLAALRVVAAQVSERTASRQPRLPLDGDGQAETL